MPCMIHVFFTLVFFPVTPVAPRAPVVALEMVEHTTSLIQVGATFDHLARRHPNREAARMHDLNRIASCCGVVLTRTAGSILHRATAWSVGPGEWITAWPGSDDDEPADPPQGLELMLASNGSVHPLTGWEWDAGIVGLNGPDIGDALPIHEDGAQLHKRDRLKAFAFPDMIDHPSVRLSRRALTPELYYPYVSPWSINGNLCLFTAREGFLTGRCYPGMAGGPVMGADGKVVGVLLGGERSPEHPPLSRFARLA